MTRDQTQSQPFEREFQSALAILHLATELAAKSSGMSSIDLIARAGLVQLQHGFAALQQQFLLHSADLRAKLERNAVRATWQAMRRCFKAL